MKSDPGFTTTGRHLCRFRSETKAYEILQKHGISKRGHIPCFHGSFDQLDPARFSPHLDSFLHDERNPSAIMLEYLPNAQRLNCENYSDERMKKVVAGINDIHSAYIEHNDPYPRNILIVPGSPERLVWIDFDIAIIYHVENTISEMERAYLKEETEVVESLGHLLVSVLIKYLQMKLLTEFHRKRIKDRDFLQILNSTEVTAVAYRSHLFKVCRTWHLDSVEVSRPIYSLIL